MINKLSILFFFLKFLNSFKLFSNNISEFAIEGISVGDSLLMYIMYGVWSVSRNVIL